MAFQEGQAFQWVIEQIIRHLDTAQDAERINQAAGAQGLVGVPGIRQRHVMKLQSIFADFEQG